jgi:phage terminase small subunit
MSLNDRQQRFVQEYCKDFNATQAGIRAGYSEKTSGQQAHELLKNPEIAAAIEERKQQLADVAEIDAAWVLRQWKQIATADANEITQLRRVCCRHCHGFGNQYQWTEAEYSAAVDKAVDSGKPAPDGMGGFGFDLNAEPHPACPECGGLGQELIYVADTRKLKGSARRLYAGVKKTKDGLQVITRDQDAALANISRYLGMLVDRKEISGPGGGPVPLAHITADDLSDDQLAAILKADGADE